jgi:hypothetical protein
VVCHRKYKVVQIWSGLFVCKQVTVCPGHIWIVELGDSRRACDLWPVVFTFLWAWFKCLEKNLGFNLICWKLFKNDAERFSEHCALFCVLKCDRSYICDCDHWLCGQLSWSGRTYWTQFVCKTSTTVMGQLIYREMIWSARSNRISTRIFDLVVVGMG